MMSAQDKAALSALPEKIQIYRGQADENHPIGYSWTTSKTVAEKFASHYQKRFTFGQWSQGDRPVVFRGIANRNSVLAFLNDREEQEVLIHPRNVRSIKARVV